MKVDGPPGKLMLTGRAGGGAFGAAGALGVDGCDLRPDLLPPPAACTLRTVQTVAWSRFAECLEDHTPKKLIGRTGGAPAPSAR